MNSSQPNLAEAPGLDDPRVIQATEEYAAALRDGQRPDRATFLARHAEIADVLGECLDGLEFICRAAPEVEPTATTIARADEFLPELRGDFRIIRKIGRGGMGVVFEAEQVSLGRRVALKVLPFAAALDERHLQRFRQEAQAAALLHHTNIVPVFAVGSEHGVHYYAMQYIEGQNLAVVIAQMRHDDAPAQGGPLDATIGYGSASHAPPAPRVGLSTERSIKNWHYVRTGANLAAQVAEALAHAHRHGVVHRDIKPANILVDTLGNPWVTDFGLARLQNEGGLTFSGDLLGTIRYMSPEQAAGGGAVVDHRTDVYSLGATLYELLTLQPAFDGEDRQMILRQILQDEPLAPRCLNESIPVDLEIVVQKAMAKNIDERYASAQEFADDLRRFLSDRPIQARRPSLSQRFLKWARRHIAVVSAGAAAAGVILIALAVSTVLVWRSKNAAQNAYANEVAQRVRAEKNLELALQALDEVYLRFAERRFPGDPLLERSDGEVLRKALSFYQQFAAENRDSPQIRWETVRAYRRVGEINQWLARPKQAEDYLRQAVAMGEKLSNAGPAESRVLAESLSSLGILLQETNRLAEAEQVHRRSLELRRHMAEATPDDVERQLDLAASKLNLGVVLNRANRLSEAAVCFGEALDELKELPQRITTAGQNRRYRILVAQAYQNRGSILAGLNRLDEAKSALQEAVDRWQALAAEMERTPGPRDNLARSLSMLGVVHGAQGNLDAAETALREALGMRDRLATDFQGVPGFRDAVASSHHDLAHLLERRGRLDDAETEARHSLAARQKLAAEFPAVPQYQEGLAKSYHKLGSILRTAGRKDEARKAFRDATAAWDRFAAEFASAPAHRFLAALGLMELSLILQSDGQLDESEQTCRRGLALLATLATDLPQMPLYAGALSNAQQQLGWILRDAGKMAESESAYRAGVSARLAMHEEARSSPQERYRLANAYHNLGEALLTRENYPEVETVCKMAIDLRKELPESLRSTPENRHLLAIDRLNLGTAAKALGHAAEATDHLAGALELARSLIKDFPKEASYQSTLSRILTQLPRASTNTTPDADSAPVMILIDPAA
jgi:serine/threonine protein kinase